LKAVGEGTAVIRAASVENPAVWVTCEVTVVHPEGGGDILDLLTRAWRVVSNFFRSIGRGLLSLIPEGDSNTGTFSVSPTVIYTKTDQEVTLKLNNPTGKKVVWSSGNTSVATVNQSGKVTAVATTGDKSTTITVKTEDGTHSATCKVHVDPDGGGYAIRGGTYNTEQGFHQGGIDISGTANYNVYAISKGTVKYKVYRAKCTHTGSEYAYLSYGALAELHYTDSKNNSRVALYAHLDSFWHGVTKPDGNDKHNPRQTIAEFKDAHPDSKTYTLENGQQYGSNISVPKGVRIGEAGDTGNSSNNHLHFAITTNGSTAAFSKANDYYPYFPTSVGVPKP